MPKKDVKKVNGVWRPYILEKKTFTPKKDVKRVQDIWRPYKHEKKESSLRKLSKKQRAHGIDA